MDHNQKIMPFSELPINSFFRWFDEKNEPDHGYFKLSDHHLTEINGYGTENVWVWLTGDQKKALVVTWDGKY